jgi:hypothetical protein
MKETFLPIPETPLLISNLGRVFNPTTNRFRKPQVTTPGYLNIISGGKDYNIHIWVCTLFNGPKPTDGKFVCRHLDDDKSNNVWTNLAWGTYQDNADDAVRNGKIDYSKALKGSEKPNSKLTETKVEEIRKLLDTGMYHKDIAKLFGVHKSQISKIKLGTGWKSTLKPGTGQLSP